jgi:hypothetical protein
MPAMPDLLEWTAGANLGGRARAVLEFLDSADPCFLGLAAAVLVFLGSRMVAGHPAVQGWGLRLAAAAFLLYGGYGWFSAESDAARLLGPLALRSACVAAAVLAVSWIVLPVLAFVQGHLRLAVAVFLCYCAYALIDAGEYNPEQFPSHAVRGLLVSGLALVIAWILSPVWAFLKNFLPQRPPAAQAQPADTSTSAPTPEVPRRAPSLVLTMPVPAETEGPTLRDREAQRRREKARLQLELTYVQALPAVGSWFPRKMFDDFVARHLGDHLPPEDVEDSARQLQAVLHRHQEEAPATPAFGNLDELGHWLLDEQQRIQALTVEVPLKQSQLLDLHQRYLLLATRLVHKQESPG